MRLVQNLAHKIQILTKNELKKHIIQIDLHSETKYLAYFLKKEFISTINFSAKTQT